MNRTSFRFRFPGKLGNASDRSPPGRSASEWKEEEVLLKIGGEIKMTNPNLEV